MLISKLFDWIKVHVWQTILIILTCFLAPLVLVHFLYKWQTSCYLLQSDWFSGDLITYIAGFEALLGSVFLGIVALKQTQEANLLAKSANQVSKQMLENEKTRDTFSRQPCIMLSDIRVKDGLSIIEKKELGSPIYNLDKPNTITNDPLEYLITITLINASTVFTEMKLISFNCQINESDPNRLTCSGTRDFPHRSTLHIPPVKTDELNFSFKGTSKTILSGMDAFLELLLVNSISEKYRETIKFTIFGVYEDKLMIEFTDYNVKKYKPASKKK